MLPNAETAVVHQAKITVYLLNPEHPKGAAKASFFTRLGFSVAQWEVMAAALLQHASQHEVVSIRQTPHCNNYVIAGELQSPDGRKPQVRTVWYPA